MNQKMQEPKTARTKNSTNQNETDVTCGKLQYFNQIGNCDLKNDSNLIVNIFSVPEKESLT